MRVSRSILSKVSASMAGDRRGSAHVEEAPGLLGFRHMIITAGSLGSAALS